jgi:hypothetical protein
MCSLLHEHILAAALRMDPPGFPKQKDQTLPMPCSFLFNEADFFANRDSCHAHFQEISFHFVDRFDLGPLRLHVDAQRSIQLNSHGPSVSDFDHGPLPNFAFLVLQRHFGRRWPQNECLCFDPPSCPYISGNQFLQSPRSCHGHYDRTGGSSMSIAAAGRAPQ